MKHRESMPPEGRDQVPTTFSEILQELLWQEPRATAAVLIDPEGETVDYASSLPSYETKVAAANLRVVLDNMVDAWKKTPSGDALTQALLRAPKRSFFVRPIADGYALVLILRRRVFAVSARAVALAVGRLAKEAGWPAPLEETLPWHPVEIETSRADRFRPMQMKTGDAWDRVEVLGSVVGLANEKGYRCRLQGGAEITLVRESTGVWFVDQPVRGLASRLGPQSVPPARAPSHPPSPARGASHPSGKTPSEGPAAEGRPPSESASENRVRTSAERGDMWAKWTKRL
ncbi:MAG TPA: roadblock/LC7 domain-containing protein [Polyangiaceae bacterium]|jgi:hypothetical protein|nr:roadblock/LC7 domain-containing protein [Polyangiaceae bacterium]